MSIFKSFVSYLVCLLLILVGGFGVFASDVFFSCGSEALFYIKISSFFILAISFLLIVHYARCVVGVKTCFYLTKLIRIVANIDINKFSKNNMAIFTQETLQNIKKIETSQMIYYVFCLPFLILFLSILMVVLFVNVYMIFSIWVAVAFSIIVIDLFQKTTNEGKLQMERNVLQNFPSIVLEAARGIQFFEAERFVFDKVVEVQKNIDNQAYEKYKKYITISLFHLCVLFCALCILYFVQEEFVVANFLDISQNPKLFYGVIFFFSIFWIAFKKSKIGSEIDLDETFKNDWLAKENFSDGTKEVDTKNMFIVFHNVSFQEPTKISEMNLFEQVSFSVLPGEFVVLTGENRGASQYIYDLLLQYYKTQSGNIYISGVHINNISRESLRNSIGLFQDNFGLVVGSIFDNLFLATKGSKDIASVAKNVGLSDVLYVDVFDEHGEIQINQGVRIRIQIARILLSSYKVLLIDAPQEFDSLDDEQLFYDFVKNIAQKKTVIIATDKLSCLVRSNKILYLGDGHVAFGTHADLSADISYQNYFKKHT